MAEIFQRTIFDTIHGEITLNRAEARIMETPYYQRLRWIRQLGFTFYVYPGATHTRHAHALGVMHVMGRILKSLQLSVPDDKFYNPKVRDAKSTFHRTMRLAAMLHDIGTFPFSHTLEIAYISHWKEQQRQHNKVMANHEVLGSHIIQNTDFDGGITKILKEEGIDPAELAKIIAGTSDNPLANQLMHSDLDADRMDYLLRDAYFTGIRLGIYDIDFLIRNMVMHKTADGPVMCFKEKAMNMVESFLISRYFWYSQIISDGTSYKFDLIAAKIYQYFLENGLAYSFDHILDRVTQKPNEYFTFNDSYFMAKLHEYLAGRIMHPMIRELSEMLAQRIPPAQIKVGPLKPTLIEGEDHRLELVRQATMAKDWLQEQVKALDPNAWLIFDIPKRDVMFTKDHELLSKDKKMKDMLATRDSAKIINSQGEPKLLIDVSNSLMSVLSQYRNFLPRLYVSPKTYELLEKKSILKKMREQDFTK